MLGVGDAAMPLAHGLEVNALTLDAVTGQRWRPAGRGRRRCWTRRRFWIWPSAGLPPWRRWCAMRQRLALAAARLPICRWCRCRRPRSSGWSAHYPQIEDILPLSPLQEGLLFHALYDAQGPDIYTVQLVLGLRGRLTARRCGLRRRPCWHGMRACGRRFRHENLSRPVQIIMREVCAALAQHRSVVAG